MNLFFNIFGDALAGVIYFCLAISGAISAVIIIFVGIALLNRRKGGI